MCWIEGLLRLDGGQCMCGPAVGVDQLWMLDGMTAMVGWG